MKMPCGVSRKKNVKASNGRVDPIRSDDEIGIENRGVERRYFGLILDFHTERARPPPQNLQERHAGAAAKAVAADTMSGATEMNFDIVPIGEVTDDGAVAFAVIGLESIERLVREDDPEAERIIGPVAFEYGDVRLRPCFFHQARKVEPGWAAADDVNFHAQFPRPATSIWSHPVPKRTRNGGHGRLQDRRGIILGLKYLADKLE